MHKNFVKTHLATAVLLAISPVMAAEQTAVAERTAVDTAIADTAMLDTIEVTAGSMYRMGEVPFHQAKSAVALSREELDRQGVRKADELGRYQAGFSNQVFGNDTNTNWFRVRGTEVTQAVDGLPTFSYGFFTPYVETFGLEAVEITKGADSMTFGAAQSGGLLNYVSKRPHKEKIGQGAFSVSLGSRSQYGFAADYTGAANADDSLRYRIVTSYNRKHGDWHGTNNKTFYLAPSLTWDISDRTQLTILTSYQRDYGTPSSNFLPQEGALVSFPGGGYLDRHDNFGDPANDRERNRQYGFGYEFSHDFANGLIFNSRYRYSYANNYHRGSYVYPSAYTATYAPLAPSAAGYRVRRGVVFNDGTSKSHTLDNNFTWQYEKGWLKNTLVIGTDYRHQQVDTRYTLGGATTEADLRHAAAGHRQAQDVSTAPHQFIKSRQLGFYLQNQSRFADNVVLGLGLRHDKARISEQNLAEEAKYNQTSYSASFMYEAPYGFNPYLAYSESFHMPIGVSGANKLYDPQITRQYEAGVKYVPTWIDGMLSLAVFHAKDDGALVSKDRGATVSSEDPIKRRGVEVQGDVNITPNWNLTLAYTYLKAYKDTATDNVREPLLPKHTVAAKTAYRFEDGMLSGLTLGAGVRYMGKSVTSQGSLYSGRELPSATVVDLMAHYQLTPNWSTQLNVDNVGNRRYLSGCDYYCYYGAERNINASLNYTF